MSEELMVREASPTLAGIKTGSLFTCPYESREVILEEIRDMNRELFKKGLCLLPVRFKDRKVLLYLFRPRLLERDLQTAESARLLREAGYREGGFQRHLTELVRRLNSSQEFPHEIGLFLSYPPEDVKGFIDNRAGKCKMVGCWKVYGDIEAAGKRFAAYKKCTDLYRAQLADGKNVLQLAVAV